VTTAPTWRGSSRRARWSWPARPFGPGQNDGIAIIEAETENDARAVMEADPAITSGLMTGELRPMRVSFLRGA
jgi:hypothetical protein